MIVATDSQDLCLIGFDFLDIVTPFPDDFECQVRSLGAGTHG